MNKENRGFYYYDGDPDFPDDPQYGEENKVCICGNHNVHTKACLSYQRAQKVNKWRREKRRKLRAEHRCIICGRKVKPIIVYHQYCSDHKPKQKNE
ncbi:MAG: hypothetical protein KAX33_10735 [Candidatus Lokiarchaeota archaeon]|nr:hypothetical protein [Candidatus Lokiarchaeota archaeon]